MTRPPDFTASPRPLTKRTPIRWSRIAPGREAARAGGAGGDEAADRGLARRAVEAPVVLRLDRQHLAAAASVSSTSRTGVPARAPMTSSEGS